MMVAGLVCLLIGLLTPFHILWVIGVVLVVVGLILAVVGASHPVGGRRHWY